MATLELNGWDELTVTLDRIDDTIKDRVMRSAVTAAGNIIAKRAKELCPVITGRLRDLISVEVREYGTKDNRRTLAIIGPKMVEKFEGGKLTGSYGHLVEYGHRIVTGRRGTRLRKKDTRSDTGRKTEPRPFIRPAFDETKAEQHAAMEEVVANAIRELGGA